MQPTVLIVEDELLVAEHLKLLLQSVNYHVQAIVSSGEAAIQRIKAGTYGICEHTGKPIAKERLLAVPFTRFSAEAQKEIERNRYRARQQAGLFGEGEEGGKIADDDSGGDE